MNPRIHNHVALPLRSRTRRAIALCAGLGALAVTLPALAAPSSKVTFSIDNGEGQAGLDIGDFVCATGASHGQNQDELDPLVSQTPLPEVVVSMVSESTTSEADVFAVDPTLHWLLLHTQAFAGLVTDKDGDAWNKLTLRPSDSQDVTLPYAVVLPYPNSDFLFIPPGGPLPVADVHLDPTKFVGGAPNAFAGLAATPKLGSVKGLRVFDHGFCSHPEELQPIYDKIQSSLWDGFVGYAQDNGADAERFYTGIVTFLMRNDKDPTDALHGGFQLAGHLAAYPSWPAPDVDANAFMEAELVLQKGHLRAEYLTPPVVLPNVASNPWVSDEDVVNLVSGMFDEVNKTISDEADAAQTIDVITDPTIEKCDPLAVDPCEAAREQFGKDVWLASLLTQYQYGLSNNPDYADDLRKTVMNQDLWSCVMTAPADPPPPPDCNPDVDPECIHDKPKKDPDPDAPPPDKAQYECRFFVPAKRLNVYPDQVELVWFDSLEESQNPAVGVFAAAHASGNKAAEEQLCSPRPDPTADEFRQREYARDFQGAHYVPAP